MVFEAPGAVEKTWHKPINHTIMAKFKQVKLVKSPILILSEVLNILLVATHPVISNKFCECPRPKRGHWFRRCILLNYHKKIVKSSTHTNPSLGNPVICFIMKNFFKGAVSGLLSITPSWIPEDRKIGLATSTFPSTTLNM